MTDSSNKAQVYWQKEMMTPEELFANLHAFR